MQVDIDVFFYKFDNDANCLGNQKNIDINEI